VHHIASRGNDKKAVFKDDQDLTLNSGCQPDGNWLIALDNLWGTDIVA